MKQVYEYWMPSTDAHFERLIKKRIKNGGPAEYQDDTREQAYRYVNDFDVFGVETSTKIMKKVANAFQTFADEPLFILTEHI